MFIRDVPDDDVARIDAEAARLGLTRSAFLRRELHHLAQRRTTHAATSEDLRRAVAAVTDLADRHVIDRAWD